MLPIPATYVIDRGGMMRGAFVEPDYTTRQEPTAILAKVRDVANSEPVYVPSSDG